MGLWRSISQIAKTLVFLSSRCNLVFRNQVESMGMPCILIWKCLLLAGSNNSGVQWVLPEKWSWASALPVEYPRTSTVAWVLKHKRKKVLAPCSSSDIKMGQEVGWGVDARWVHARTWVHRKATHAVTMCKPSAADTEIPEYQGLMVQPVWPKRHVPHSLRDSELKLRWRVVEEGTQHWPLTFKYSYHESTCAHTSESTYTHVWPNSQVNSVA